MAQEEKRILATVSAITATYHLSKLRQWRGEGVTVSFLQTFPLGLQKVPLNARCLLIFPINMRDIRRFERTFKHQ